MDCKRRLVAILAVAMLAVATALLVDRPSAQAATAPSGPFAMNAVRVDPPPPMVASLDNAEWRRASCASLNWDFTFHRPATEQTRFCVLYDSTYIYVACVAKQRAPVIATQHTNDVGDDLDDNCAFNIWPSGPSGIRYKFTSTSIGTRYQESSENDSYAPHWDAVGTIGKDGFTIVMRIRFDVMRGDGRSNWLINFQRLRVKTGELFIWATNPAMQEDDEGLYAGHLNNVVGIYQVTRARARFGVYALGALAAKSAGGPTSRMGVDFAIPIARGTSILGTIHPDYSNVELDQQAIQPSEFTRVLLEVRPFFVQGANYYNRFEQIGNTNNIMLYTPNIPTPRTGVAIEGNEGGVSFAGFDSVGATSIDSADAVFWNSPDKRWLVGYQRVAEQSGLYDMAQAGTVRYDNQRNLFAYASYGADSGTNVISPDRGKWLEFGAGYYQPTGRLAAAIRSIGPYYNPVDGIVDHTNIAGYAIEGTKRYDLAPTDWLRYIELNGDFERYNFAYPAKLSSCTQACALLAGLNQADQSVDVIVAAKNLFTFTASTGSHFLISDQPGAMYNDNLLGLTYNADSATPISLLYTYGSFANGYSRAWTRTAAFHMGPRGIVDFEWDTSNFAPRAANAVNQTLLRLGFSYQLSSEDAFTAGIRRVYGEPANIGAGIQINPGTNISFAFHHRGERRELFVVYGNPNADTTYPALTVKLIQYFGAEKGT